MHRRLNYFRCTNGLLTGYLEDGFTGQKTQPTLQQYQSTEGNDATKVRKTQKTESLEKSVMIGTLSSHRRRGKTKTSWIDNVDWTGLMHRIVTGTDSTRGKEQITVEMDCQ